MATKNNSFQNFLISGWFATLLQISMKLYLIKKKYILFKKVSILTYEY